jgi:glycosyltransferase involved in cell wall biosynthesis
MGLPRISVVMPSYNQQQFLERSILSVLNQNYPDFELIIIDGGSHDGTLDVIKKYQRHLAYWESGQDEGQSDALNKGFAHATGEIYGWLNSDDLYLPGAFFRAMEAFRIEASARVVFGDWWEIDGEDRVVSVNYAFDFNLGHFIHEGFHLNSQAMFWRREAHQRFGKFDVALHRTMDYDLILRLGLAEGQAAFRRIPHPLACFRRHAQQKTQGFDRAVQEEHRRIAAQNKVGIKYSQLGKALRLAYRFRRAYWYVKRGGLEHFLTQSAPWRTRLLRKPSD